MDCTTLAVTMGGAALPISVAQYIVDEAARQLAEQRRIAAALQLKANIEAAAATQKLRDSIRM
jgi:uncharacterized membrane protein